MKIIFDIGHGTGKLIAVGSGFHGVERLKTPRTWERCFGIESGLVMLNTSKGVNLMTASNQWMNRPDDERFQTLDALYDVAHARRMRSMEKVAPIGKVHAEADGTDIVFNSGIRKVSPSNWAFNQFGAAIKAPVDYLRRLPVGTAVQCLNDSISAMATVPYKFMTLTNPDGGNNRLQAITGENYGRIFDADVANCARQIVDRTNGRFFNPKAYDRHTGLAVPSGLYLSDRDVWMFFIDGGSRLDVGPRAQLNRGFFLWNSEVGRRTLGMTMFYFNEVCGNHIVWGATGITELRIRHTSGGPGRFINEAMPTLLAYVNASAAPAESAIHKAMDYLLPVTKREEVIEWLTDQSKTNNAKLTKSEAVGAYDTAIEEEGECRTLWNVVQGITAHARDFSFIDARTELEAKVPRLMKLVA